MQQIALKKRNTDILNFSDSSLHIKNMHIYKIL